MVEGAPQMANQPETGDLDGNVENERPGPRWLSALLLATCPLVIIAVGAYLWLGRALFQRPFLILAVLVA
ncbi:hypothetical protein ACFLYD_03050 [Chloroflexota bacterium]|jgi:hypothetical protein